MNVSNTLTIVYEDDTQRTIPVQVPSSLFPFMMDVMKVPLAARVSLSLYEVGKWWYLTLERSDDESAFYSLCKYRKSSPPPVLADVRK